MKSLKEIIKENGEDELYVIISVNKDYKFFKFIRIEKDEAVVQWWEPKEVWWGKEGHVSLDISTYHGNIRISKWFNNESDFLNYVKNNDFLFASIHE